MVSSWVMPPGAFRLFLALLVVLNHSTRVDFGYMAVFLFFILSGFWITRMWREKYSHLESPYTSFIMSRIWRLWPMFLIANVLAIAIYFSLTGSLDMSAASVPSNIFVLGLASFLGNGARLGQAWSLDIEVQFYLIAPVVIWLAARPISAVYIALAVLAFIGSVGMFFLLPATTVNHSVFSFLGFFLIGIFAAGYDKPVSKMMVTVATLFGLAVIAAFLAHPELRYIILGGRHPQPIFAYNWPLSAALALIFAPYVMATTLKPSPQSDRDMGDLSYIVYLVHMPILSIYVFYFGQLPVIERVPHLTVTLAVIAGVSLALLRFVDRPLEVARARFASTATRPPRNCQAIVFELEKH